MAQLNQHCKDKTKQKTQILYWILTLIIAVFFFYITELFIQNKRKSPVFKAL